MKENLDWEFSKQTSIGNCGSTSLGLWWFEGAASVLSLAGRCLVWREPRVQTGNKGEDGLKTQIQDV